MLLRREGWLVNTKRVYQLYREEGLQVRTKKGGKRVAQARVPLPEAVRPNQRWSMDFVSNRSVDNGWFRILTVVDWHKGTNAVRRLHNCRMVQRQKSAIAEGLTVLGQIVD